MVAGKPEMEHVAQPVVLTCVLNIDVSCLSVALTSRFAWGL